MRDELHNFLFDLGTTMTPHGGGFLFDHLKGVHDLLRDWDNDEDVCNAGLFHSIYGTQIFRHKSLHSRDQLTKLIGDHAENLVQMFSLSDDRPLFGNVRDKKIRSQLQEIEAANLVEQHGSRSSLRRLLSMKLSDGARAAILLELA